MERIPADHPDRSLARSLPATYRHREVRDVRC
jgi:hypothetical protein